MVWNRSRELLQRRFVRKQVWLPWTRSTVWNMLIQPHTLVYCADLHAWRDEQGRPLESGDMLWWERATPLSLHRHLLLIEQVTPSHTIQLRVQSHTCQRIVEIVLEPGEGGEATRIEVNVAGTSRHARFLSWGLDALCTPAINLCIAQAEQGTNAVYLYWRRVQAKRVCLQRQVITEMWRLR